MKKQLIGLFLFLVVGFVFAQDSTNYYQTVGDSINPFFDTTKNIISENSTPLHSIFENENATKKMDIEVPQNRKSNVGIFCILFFLSIGLTLLKVLFAKDFEDLIDTLKSDNLATQIVRSKHQVVSFFSLFLSINFIVVASLIFVLLQNYFHQKNNNIEIIFLGKVIFLFTFFILFKLVVLKIIGFVFSVENDVERYEYNYFTVLKVLGIIGVPIIFIWLVSANIVVNFLIVLIALILFLGVVVIVLRGLSTSVNLLYKSLYHFLIYICVVELVPVFLLIKLLTKTAV